MVSSTSLGFSIEFFLPKKKKTHGEGIMPPFASQVTAAGPPSSAMEGSTKPTRDGSPAIGHPQLGGKK